MDELDGRLKKCKGGFAKISVANNRMILVVLSSQASRLFAVFLRNAVNRVTCNSLSGTTALAPISC